MPDEAHAITKMLPTEFDRRAFFTKIGTRFAGHCRRGHCRLLLRISLAQRPL